MRLKQLKQKSISPVMLSMLNSITPSFGISAGIHVIVILVGSLIFYKPTFIVVPVEINLVGSSAPPSKAPETTTARSERLVRDDKDQDVPVVKKENDSVYFIKSEKNNSSIPEYIAEKNIPKKRDSIVLVHK